MNKLTNIQRVSQLMPPENGPIEKSWEITGEEAGDLVVVKFYEHPNEFSESDLESIPKLVQEIRNKIKKGTVMIIFGNINAGNERYKTGDTNRIYGKPNKNLSDPEQARVEAIENILSKSKICIDGHATRHPLQEGQEFSVIPSSHSSLGTFEIGAKLGHPILVHENASNKHHPYAQYSDEFTFRNGGIGITMEDGSIHDPNFQRTTKGIISVLEATGSIKTRTLHETCQQAVFQTSQDIIAEGDSFQLTKVFKNWEKIKKDTPVASYYDETEDRLIIIRAQRDCYALFAREKSAIEYGQRAILLVPKY